MNRLRYRAWNYILMTTPTHMIQFNFVDVMSFGEGGRGFCPSSLIILDKRNPRGTFKKVEESTFTCPEFDRHTLFDFKNPPTLVGNGGSLKMSITPIGNMKYQVRVQETTIDLDLDLTFDYNTAPSQVYLTPLDRDRLAYFSTLKKPGLVATGSYTYQGTRYPCTATSKDSSCLMILDIGRTTQVYGIQYFWVLLMTKLRDGRVVSFNLGDGMNSGYGGLDQSSEDFVSIDGEYYKLDITRMIS